MTYTTNWSRFVMRYSLVLIGIALVIYTVRELLDYNLRSSGATMVPIILATMLEGREYAKAEGDMPRGPWAWRQALMLGLIGLGVTMGFSAFFLIALPGGTGLLLTPVGFVAASIVTLIFAILFVLSARLFFGLGARNHLKAQE